jgi:hypothetical protein
MRIFPHATLTFNLLHLKKLICFSQSRLAILFKQCDKPVHSPFGGSRQLFFRGARINRFKIELYLLINGVSLEKSHFIFYDT